MDKTQEPEDSQEAQETPEDPDLTEEQPLDPETRARRDAALGQIRRLGDPVLRARALEVERFDGALREEARRMGELMHDALGIGLAANQVGVLSRLLVYQADPEDPVRTLVNPVIEWSSEEIQGAREGCLSIPRVNVVVERPFQVRVRAQDERGRPLEIAAEGLEARVIQHEIDHLDGVLILDRIPRKRRKLAMRALREGLSYDEDPPDEGRPDEDPADEVVATASTGSDDPAPV